MAEENITLISKEYASDVFQSKLTEANEGDNIKITREGDNLKISAEVPAPGQTTITTSDERVVVNKTETGYDLALNGSFIEGEEFNEFKEGVNTEISNLHGDIEGSLRPAVESNTEDIEKLNNDVNRIDTGVGELTSTVASLEQSVEGNKEAITDLEQDVAGKQDALKYISEYEDAGGSSLDLGGRGGDVVTNMTSRSSVTRICGGDDVSDMWSR